MKKPLGIIVLLCILCILLSLCTLPISATALAVEAVDIPVMDDVSTVDASTRALAYQDIDKARAEIKAEIILARNEIIRNESWCDDGFMSEVGDARTGEVLETLPQFSELFPGWENLSEGDILAAQQVLADRQSPKQAKTTAEIRKYAYMDVEEAMDAVERDILSARKEVIYSESWVADGYEAYVGDLRTGEIVEILPKFSELFPDWDLPVEKVEPFPTDESGIMPLQNEIYYRTIYLSHPSPVITRPFFQTTTLGVREIRSYATQLTGSNCNIGFTNMATGVSITQKLRMAPWQYVNCRFGNVTPIGVGVRASTYSTEGNATIATERMLAN